MMTKPEESRANKDKPIFNRGRVPPKPEVDNMARFYKLEEVLRLLRVSRGTIDRMAKRGELPGRRKIGGQVFYHRATIDRWIDEGE